VGYYAEINAAKTVLRVVVADSAAWCTANLGGTWVETSDPYAEGPQSVTYCGPGYGYDRGVPERFVGDVWSAAKATTPDMETGAYRYVTQGELTWHNGRAWRNLNPQGNPNVWEPGVANWREYPIGTNHPRWVQPVGAIDAYPVDFVVEHRTGNKGPLRNWRSTTPANVWEPGVFGWVQI
jgi:hypothetical protein